jgi:large subunit ribosomal protein L17
MHHLKKGRKLNRNSSHRRAMLQNLTCSIFKHDCVNTTSAKAKEVRRFVEKIVALAKKNTVHNRRLVYKKIKNRDLLKKIFDTIPVKYDKSIGGCTRIIKNGFRKGDGASMSLIQFVTK